MFRQTFREREYEKKVSSYFEGFDITFTAQRNLLNGIFYSPGWKMFNFFGSILHLHQI